MFVCVCVFVSVSERDRERERENYSGILPRPISISVYYS